MKKRILLLVMVFIILTIPVFTSQVKANKLPVMVYYHNEQNPNFQNYKLSNWERKCINTIKESINKDINLILTDNMNNDPVGISIYTIQFPDSLVISTVFARINSKSQMSMFISDNLMCFPNSDQNINRLTKDLVAYLNMIKTQYGW